MDPLSIDEFLTQLSREEGVNLMPLAPFVRQYCRDSYDLGLAKPYELERLGISKQAAELLTARAYERESALPQSAAALALLYTR